MMILKVQRGYGNQCLIYNFDKSIFCESLKNDSFFKKIHLGKMCSKYYYGDINEDEIIIKEECLDSSLYF